MEDRTTLEMMGRQLFRIRTQNQFEASIEDSERLHLDLVVLKAQGFSLLDEKDLADIEGSLGEDLLVPPRLVDHACLMSDRHYQLLYSNLDLGE
jgi:hypothetical protein